MPKSTKPIYQTILEELKQQIVGGGLNPGDMLPSEDSLTQHYQTSRMTVRKSLAILDQEKLIYSCQGKGYFVASPAYDSFAIKFSDEENGFDVVFKNINAGYPSAKVSAALEIAPSQIVIEVVRVIKKQGKPVALDIKHIPYDKGLPSLEEEMRYSVFPEIVRSKVPPFAFHTRLEIAAELPGKQLARQLECSTQEPLLVVYRWLIDQNEKPIGYGIKYILPEYGHLLAYSSFES